MVGTEKLKACQPTWYRENGKPRRLTIDPLPMRNKAGPHRHAAVVIQCDERFETICGLLRPLTESIPMTRARRWNSGHANSSATGASIDEAH